MVVYDQFEYIVEDLYTDYAQLSYHNTSYCGKKSVPCLTHLPLDKMSAFSQTIFSDAIFVNENDIHDIFQECDPVKIGDVPINSISWADD